MRAQADGLVYAADGTPMLCEQHGGAFHVYEAICTLNGEPCSCWSADEEAGEVWVYVLEHDEQRCIGPASDEQLQGITAYDLFRGEDYALKEVGVAGNPLILQRLRGDVKLHLTCISCPREIAA